MTKELRIGVLGPLQGTCDGTRISMPGGRPGVLLAVLAMCASSPVSVERLAELIWAEEQPERMRPSLHTLVARLRRSLPDVVVTSGDGYLLDVDPDQVDLLRFRRLMRAAERASTATARQLLDQALGLWRGEPLSGLRSVALEREVIPGLTDERLSAIQKRADLELAVGGSARVIAELRGLTSQYPLREPLWGQLMHALSGAGRPAEAIQEYHRARKILANELGIDPSPELQGLYQMLLQADRRETVELEPPSASEPQYPDHDPYGSFVPRQLPGGPAGFVGRAAQLSVLWQLADECGTNPGAVVVAAITGMAGVGKTALALQWGHRAVARFPDGQLYANLRGFDPSAEPSSPMEIVSGFLEALGVTTTSLPDSLESRTALYRTILADQRVLIVLDNVRDAEQVRPLLPSSPGCLVLITSRSPLASLAVRHNARLISLDVLTDGEASEMLAARLGAERTANAQEPAAELVALCGRLPLALAIIAARAAARPKHPLSVFAGELRDERTRLDALSAGDQSADLRAVFSWSFRQLSESAAGLFRLLGVHPGPDIALSAAASLAGTGLAAAAEALSELVGMNMVTEHRPGGYALHPLLRLYASEQAGETDWFDSESEVLLAVEALAADSDFEAMAWNSLGCIYRQLDHPGKSLKCYHRAVRLFTETGNRAELAAALNDLGDAYLTVGDVAGARDAWEQAVSVATGGTCRHAGCGPAQREGASRSSCWADLKNHGRSHLRAPRSGSPGLIQ